MIIVDTRRTARRKATLDLILQHESDRELIGAREDFNRLKSSTTRIGVYGMSAHKSSKDDNVLRKILNLHEITALSIEENVIDERVYRRWFNSSFIDDYSASKDYIEEARLRGSKQGKPPPRYYCDFEKLALRWAEDKDWSAQDTWLRRKWLACRRVLRA